MLHDSFKTNKQRQHNLFEWQNYQGFSRALASWIAAVFVAITPAESLIRAANWRTQPKSEIQLVWVKIPKLIALSLAWFLFQDLSTYYLSVTFCHFLLSRLFFHMFGACTITRRYLSTCPGVVMKTIEASSSKFSCTFSLSFSWGMTKSGVTSLSYSKYCQ